MSNSEEKFFNAIGTGQPLQDNQIAFSRSEGRDGALRALAKTLPGHIRTHACCGKHCHSVLGRGLIATQSSVPLSLQEPDNSTSSRDEC